MDEQGNFMELGMEESDESGDGEEGDEEDDDDDDEDGSGGDEDEQAASWGTRKRAYYSSGSGDEEDEEFEDSDEEAAINEEAEVKRLQKKRAQERSEADFADAFSVLAKKPSSRNSASSLAADLHEGIHADLHGMDQDGYAIFIHNPPLFFPCGSKNSGSRFLMMMKNHVTPCNKSHTLAARPWIMRFLSDLFLIFGPLTVHLLVATNFPRMFNVLIHVFRLLSVSPLR
jgi:hypothetical protein